MSETRNGSGQTSRVGDYLGTLRRRAPIVLAVAVAVPSVATLAGTQQSKIFEASADVVLTRGSLANTLTGANDPTNSQTDDAIVETQKNVARSPVIVRRTLADNGVPRRSVQSFLDASNVTPKPNTLFMSFTVKDVNPRLAELLATDYAKQYIVYRRQLDTAVIRQALAEVVSRRQALTAGPKGSEPLVNSLARREEQLRTLQALQTANAAVTREATDSIQVQPRLIRNAVLGLVIGALLGVLLAIIREATDTRVRREEEVSEALGLPLLGRLPAPDRKYRDGAGVPVVDQATGPYAEAFAIARTGLAFMMLDRSVGVLAVTSALAGEGKSTTATNLAASFARRGQSVILVDLDLRRGTASKMFHTEAQPGVTSVALGEATLEEALRPISLEAVDSASPLTNEGGTLSVLASGPLHPAPSEFAASRGLADLLQQLRSQADLVIIDAPPLLPVSDVVTLSPNVDGLVVLTRLDLLRRPQLRELARVLATARAPALGFYVTGMLDDLGAGYGQGYGYGTGANGDVTTPDPLARAGTA